MPYYLSEKNRGYLLTESGQERLAEAGLAGCYVDADGRVAIPGKPTTEGAAPAPTKEEYLKVFDWTYMMLINFVCIFVGACNSQKSCKNSSRSSG